MAETSHIIMITIGCVLIGLLTVNIHVLSVGIKRENFIESHESRISTLEKYYHGSKGELLNSVLYELKNPSLREVNTTLNTSTYVITGFEQVRETGAIFLAVNQAGVFIVEANGTYTTTAKVAVEDEVKLVAVGLFINDEACDKTVKPIAKIENPETGKYYKTKITITVQCLSRDLKKGDEITLRYYHPYNMEGTPESDAENWLQINHMPI